MPTTGNLILDVIIISAWLAAGTMGAGTFLDDHARFGHKDTVYKNQVELDKSWKKSRNIMYPLWVLLGLLTWLGAMSIHSSRHRIRLPNKATKMLFMKHHSRHLQA